MSGCDAGRGGRGCVGDVGDLRRVERDGTLRADVDGARRPCCGRLLGDGIGVVLVLPDDVSGLVYLPKPALLWGLRPGATMSNGSSYPYGRPPRRASDGDFLDGGGLGVLAGDLWVDAMSCSYSRTRLPGRS